jgi:hypothetical protein
MRIWTARVQPPKSTTEVPFRTPLAILPLMGGGGGVRNWARNSRTDEIYSVRSTVSQWIPDPPCQSTFNEGGGGVRNSVVCEVGPLSVNATLVSRSPFSTCTIPKRATGLVLIGDSLPL